MLNPNETYAVGPYAITDYYMESRKAQAHAMENAKQVIKDIAEEFEKISDVNTVLLKNIEWKMLNMQLLL